jgi:type II secretory pathway component PulL
MKKRINLFTKKKRFNTFEAYAVKIRKYGSILGVLFFFLFITVMYQIFIIQREISQLSAQKKEYLSQLLNEKDIEANIRYFKGKQTQLISFEKDDARFLPYYSVLLNVLFTSTESAKLESIQIDKNRTTSFIIKFDDYNGMISFLKYVESSEFLEKFESLSMASLSLTRDPQQSQSKTAMNYQLQFKGKFKEIKDESS